jgi:hypothetical protein
MAVRSKPANVVDLFQPDQDGDGVGRDVVVGRPVRRETITEVDSRPQALDLEGQPKIVMAIGPGNTGKTTLLRYIAERTLEGQRNVVFAAVDPENRELADYFEGVQQPPSYDATAVSKWVEQFLIWAMKNRRSAVVDFGGGDTSLVRLVSEIPDLADMMESSGVHPVALYLLSPRLGDLSPLATLEGAGFKPKATALICNEGVADPTLARERSFARTMRHPDYEAAIGRGAIPIWMPRLHSAKEVEDRRISYAQARDGTMPDGRRGVAMNPFDQSRVRAWLDQMAAAFSPISSWLP